MPSNSGFIPSKARNSPKKQPFEFCSRQPEKGSSNALFYMNSHQRTHIFGRKSTFAGDQIKRIPNDFQNPCFLLSPLIWLWNVFWWEGCGRSRNSVAHSARVRAGWSIIGQPGVERIWSEENFKKIIIIIMMIMIIIMIMTIIMVIMWVINYM